MNNVTITVADRALAWARVQAAERNMSLSRFVGELLHERMGQSQEYRKAYAEFLAEKPLKLRKDPGERYLTREEANDRAALRRR